MHTLSASLGPERDRQGSAGALSTRAHNWVEKFSPAPRTPQRQRPPAAGGGGRGAPQAPALSRRPRRLSPCSGAALRASSPARSAPAAGRSAMGTARRASRARAAAEHSAGRSRRSSGRMPGRDEQRCPPGSRGAGAGLAEPPRPSGKRRGNGAVRPWNYSSRHAPRRPWRVAAAAGKERPCPSAAPGERSPVPAWAVTAPPGERRGLEREVRDARAAFTRYLNEKWLPQSGAAASASGVPQKNRLELRAAER